jgi:hypothetical protein
VSSSRFASVTAATSVAVALAVGCSSNRTDSSAPAHPTQPVERSLAASVVVPSQALHTDIAGAYDLLHRAGLRVTLTRRVAIMSLADPLVTVRPRPGTRVPRGSVVKMTPVGTPLGSPVVLKSDPHYPVPNFVAKRLSTAVKWANQHSMYWAIPTLPAAGPSDADHLFDQYRITEQQPRPGATIRQGVREGRGFKPTPLTLTVRLAH